jgi:Uma2 family endonuclease
MASSSAISVEENLQNSYGPDCDYVDGELVERNVGEWKHSLPQGILIGYFRDLSRALPVRVAPDSRTAYSYTREEGREVRDRLTTQDPEISISVPELFAELDEALKDEA